MIFEMKLAPDPFSKIKDGRKIYELRLNDEKRSKIKAGDIINFTQTQSGERLSVQAVALHKFESFEKLYARLPLEKCGYSETDSPSPEDMYEYYKKDDEKKYGVLAIEIKALK